MMFDGEITHHGDHAGLRCCAVGLCVYVGYAMEAMKMFDAGIQA